MTIQKHTVTFELSYWGDKALKPQTLRKALGTDLDVEGMWVKEVRVGQGEEGEE